MQKVKNNHKTNYYRVVKSREMIGKSFCWMYGIEGFSNGESVSLRALSFDRNRVEKLVDTMNSRSLELKVLREVVDTFLLSR